MNKLDIVQWVQNEFTPVSLITEERTLLQLIENAVRYFNINSAMKYVEMVTASISTVKVQVSNNIKMVAKVLPATPSNTLLANYPVWSLTGIAILDAVSSDMILMNEAFKNYRYYIGSDFRWHFERNEDPTEGGWLYLQGVPESTSKLCVIGTKRILEDVIEDSYVGSDYNIKDEFILNWLLYYVKALVKMVEGNALRKTNVLSIKNDGQEMYSEGKEEKEELEQRLRDQGRWVSFMRRF